MLKDFRPTDVLPHTRILVRWALRSFVRAGDTLTGWHPYSPSLPELRSRFAHAYDKVFSERSPVLLTKDERQALDLAITFAERVVSQVHDELTDLGIQIHDVENASHHSITGETPHIPERSAS